MYPITEAPLRELHPTCRSFSKQKKAISRHPETSKSKTNHANSQHHKVIKQKKHLTRSRDGNRGDLKEQFKQKQKLSHNLNEFYDNMMTG